MLTSASRTPTIQGFRGHNCIAGIKCPDHACAGVPCSRRAGHSDGIAASRHRYSHHKGETYISTTSIPVPAGTDPEPTLNV